MNAEQRAELEFERRTAGAGTIVTVKQMEQGFGILATEKIVVHDVVRISNGDEMVVTGYHPNRPANPWTGVLVNGQGAEYKFGPRNQPRKIGHTGPDHPALLALQRRLEARARRSGVQIQTTEPPGKVVVMQLVAAVEAGQWDQAKALAAAVKSLGWCS